MNAPIVHVPDQAEADDAKVLTLAGLPFHATWIEISQTGRMLELVFEAHPEIPGLLLLRDGALAGMLTLARYQTIAARPLQRDVFLNRPISALPSSVLCDPLLLPHDTLVNAAAGAALLRSREIAYDPIVVAFPEGRFGVIDYRVLLREVVNGLNRNVAALHQSQESLRQAKEQAEAATRAKSAFLAIMSHEIRTPMNGLLGMIDLLDRTPLDEGQKRSIAVIRESAKSLMHIIGDILDFSKIEAGRIELECQPIALEEILESVIASLAPIAHKKGVRLLCHIDPAFPPGILGDAVRLRQIAYNLIGNALKFTQDGHVSARFETMRRSEGSISLRWEISDTGIGLTRQQIALLFKPFVQAENSTTRRYGGTGLGLSICAQLVELMGGRIVADGAPGLGSTFLVDLTLPVVEADAAPRSSSIDALTIGLHIAQERDYATCLAYLEADGAQIIDLDSGDAEVIVSDGSYTGGFRSVVTLTRDDFPLLRSALRRAVAIAAGRSADPVAAGPSDDIRKFRPSAPLLVADDHPTNREVILRQLELLGCAADAVANGREALDALARKSYSLLLSDYEMPEMDGVQLTTAIRAREAADPAIPRLPIIGFTANALAAQARQCLDAGMDVCLVKPLLLVDLARSLARWIPADDGAVVAMAREAAADSPTQAAIDLRLYTELMGDDREAIAGLLRRFRETCLPVFTSLTEAIAHPGRGEELRREAHRLKGAAYMAGAMALGRVCEKIETAAAKGDSQAIPPLLPDLIAEWENATRFIDNFRP